MKLLAKAINLVSNITRYNQRGAALVEATLIAPFIVAVFFGLVDLGRALNQYLVISRLGYESARSASLISDLAPGTTIFTKTGCQESSSTDQGEPGLLKVATSECDIASERLKNRIQNLIAKHQISDDYEISTSVTQSRARTQNDKHYLSVSLSVNVPFDWLFLKFMPEKIGTTLTGPYLFPSQA